MAYERAWQNVEYDWVSSSQDENSLSGVFIYLCVLPVNTFRVTSNKIGFVFSQFPLFLLSYCYHKIGHVFNSNTDKLDSNKLFSFILLITVVEINLHSHWLKHISPLIGPRCDFLANETSCKKGSGRHFAINLQVECCMISSSEQ